MFQLTLFGEVQLTSSQGEIELGGPKLEGLLCVLAAARGKPVARETLTELLWGHRSEVQARQSLRQALTRLRKALGEALVTDERFVRLRTDLVRSDYGEFERLCDLADIEALRTAAALSQQELLAGLCLRETAFTEWLSSERRRIAVKARQVTLQLSHLTCQSGNSEHALSLIEGLLDHDPLDEDAHRVRISLLSLLGRRAEALKSHAAFSQHMMDQLGVAPATETEELVQRLRSHSSPAAAHTARAPSLLVLPFVNLSGDDQEYFTQGMVDEIIVGLSRLHWLTVLSRATTFSEKARGLDPRRAGAEFGVRYALAASIRRVGSAVRIMGQLIETASGAAIWTERFDGALEDVFELQDQLAARVVAALQPKLERAEMERARRKPTDSLDAYDCYLRGLAEVHQWTRGSNILALDYLYRAIKLDDRFAAAYAAAARCYSQRKTAGWVADETSECAEAERLAHCAIELGEDDAVVLSTAGITIAFVTCRVPEGQSLIDRALALNPGLSAAWLYSGWVRAWSGEPDAAITHLRRAMELSPHDPYEPAMNRAMSFALFIGQRYEEALARAQRITMSPQNAGIAAATSAASATLLGLPDAAKEHFDQLRALEPGLRGANLRRRFPIVKNEDFARLADALAKAGLPS